MAPQRERVDGDFGSVGSSDAMAEVREFITRVGDSDATVLILGETGTGKELIARAICRQSRRHDKRFVALNCASLSEGVLESELFGHIRGAFTDAPTYREGRFEYASGGTIFLDEINSTELAFQIKLLRVLEEKEVVPVGGNQSVTVDVRVIAAANEDLATAMAEGRFRRDLFYRLDVLTVTVPPLRKRDDDVIELAHHFLREYSRVHGRRFRKVAPEAENLLRRHSWPGNVRELMNLIESAVVLAVRDGPDELLELPVNFESQPASVRNETDGVGQIADIVYDDLLDNKPLLEGIRRDSTRLRPLANLVLEGIILGLDRYLSSERGQEDVLEMGYFMPRLGLKARRAGSESLFNKELRDRVSQLLDKHRQE
jgi:two-component system response regulator HydG